MAAHQGGYLLSLAASSSRPMAMALDLTLDSIEARRARPRHGELTPFRPGLP